MPGLSDYVNGLYGLNPTLDFGDVLAYGGQDKVTEELAVYGELTAHLNDSLSVTGGFRAFKLSTEGTGGIPIPFASRTLAWYYGDPLDDFLLGGIEPLSYDDDGVIFRLNTAYEINEDMLVYATWAQGFRAGRRQCPAREGRRRKRQQRAFDLRFRQGEQLRDRPQGRG